MARMASAAFAALCVILISATAQAQHGANLCSLLEQSSRDPYNFDNVVNQNQNLFTPSLRNHMTARMTTLSQQGQAHMNWCSSMYSSGSQQLTNCNSNNPASMFAMWLLSLQQRLAGTRWLETMYGSMDRQSLEMAMPLCNATGMDCQAIREMGIQMTAQICPGAFN